MRYLIMIYSNPKSRAVWETLTDEQQMEFGRAHQRLDDELAASGDLVIAEGLAGPELSKSVAVRDGQMLVSDGPFVEVKEYLAGFYLVECETIDDAVKIAARVPDAATNQVEVRPVFDMSVLEDL